MRRLRETPEQQIKAIQRILRKSTPGLVVDGVWGPKSQAALDDLTHAAPVPVQYNNTYASSFADPADIEAFDKCKAAGGTDDECFKYGDNGIGCWGDSTVKGTGPSCALPPEYMEEKWGSVANAKNKLVKVVRGNQPASDVICTLKDRMPHLENLANEARIDLNYDACAALGWKPPIMEKVIWWWV